MEDTSRYVTEQFKLGLEQVELIKKRLKNASKKDPVKFDHGTGPSPLD